MPERTWYQIRAAADDDTAEVLIYDQIGESFWDEGVTAKAMLAELAAITAPAITLRINSPGGSVFDGVAIYNALKRHPAKVTTHVDGLAASIASVIALAGDEVHMAANALFMIHNPYGMAMGEADEMRKVADVLDKVRDTMVATYAEHCALTGDELAAAMDAETWYTAAEALEAGFATHVGEALRVAATYTLAMPGAPEFRNPPADLAARLRATPTVPAAAAAAPVVTPAPTQEEEPPMPDTSAAAPTPPPAPAHRSALPSVAEYIIAAARQDDAVLADYRQRISAAADTFVEDIPGIIPETIVTPVVSLRDAAAPLFNALGPNVAPAGQSFNLPKITKHLTDAAAAAEGTDVTDDLKIGEVPVTMAFVKRAAPISYEAIQYSQPGIVGLVQNDLVESVLLGCENVIKTQLEAAAGTNAAVALANDGSDAWKKLAAAVSTFYGACGQMPDLVTAAPDVWAALAGMTNQLGAPLINGVNQTLSGSWGTLFGIPVVVSPKLTAGKAFMLSTYGVKSWAAGPVYLEVTKPSTFMYELGGGRSVGLSIADGKFITPLSVAAPAAVVK